MSTIDRAALIEQAAAVLVPWRTKWNAEEGCNISYILDARELAEAALPVIAKALLAPLRELHRPTTHQDPEYAPYCSGCWEAGDYDGAPTYPCPTVRLLDELEAEVQP